MNHDNFTEVTSEDAPKGFHILEAYGWAFGYNTCLERTNAAELLQCLIQVKEDYESMGVLLSDTLDQINNAIKKATDENSHSN